MVLVPMERSLFVILDVMNDLELTRTDYGVYPCARNYQGVPPCRVWYGSRARARPCIVSPCRRDESCGWLRLTILRSYAFPDAGGVLMERYEPNELPAELLCTARLVIEAPPIYRDCPRLWWYYWDWSDWARVQRLVRRRAQVDPSVLEDWGSGVTCAFASLARCSERAGRPLRE